MLKKRIIRILLLKDDRVCKTIQFENSRDVGFPKTAVKVYESQDADEIIVLNIKDKITSFSELIKWTNILSQECAMPLAVGGGIGSFEQVQELFYNGADKVLLNSVNYADLGVLEKTAATFGAQSIIVGIDVKYDSLNNQYCLYSDSGKILQKKSLKDHIETCDAIGVGEFFIQSIERDGVMKGLDIELGKQVTKITRRPVILAGGIGMYSHLEEAFKNSDIAGIGCASIFHFTDSNPLRANAYLANAGISVKRV